MKARMAALDKVIGRKLMMIGVVLSVALVGFAIGTTITSSSQSAAESQHEVLGSVAIIATAPDATTV